MSLRRRMETDLDRDIRDHIEMSSGSSTAASRTTTTSPCWRGCTRLTAIFWPRPFDRPFDIVAPQSTRPRLG